LAARLNISSQEAKLQMENYFKIFPKLKTFLDNNADISMRDNRITSLPPTGRIRFFHFPNNEGEKQSIGRAGRNYVIQESSASMLKIALIKLRIYILENDFPAMLHLPVHDEILSSCHKDRAEEWSDIQATAMRDAADLFLKPGLLTVDTKILERWTK